MGGYRWNTASKGDLSSVSIDQFIQRNEPSWNRLVLLSDAARGRKPRIGPDELDEFVQLYQQASTHLAHARTSLGDPALTMRLTRIVADANGVLYGRTGSSRAAIADFFRYTFPAAVWSARRFIMIAAALMFVPAIVIAIWFGTSDHAVNTYADEAAREAYINEDIRGLLLVFAGGAVLDRGAGQ